MSSAEDLEQLRSVLPPGDYRDLSTTGVGKTLMAEKAIFGSATWLSPYERRVFIKLYRGAGPGAGKTTQLLGSNERLLRLSKRFEALSREVDTSQAVPISLVRLSHQPDLLLVVMDHVDPLLEHIKLYGPDPEIAADILEVLTPTPQSRWVHTDICPRNIGLLRGRRPCMLDLESMYLIEPRGIGATVITCKPHRSSRSVNVELLKQQANGGEYSTATCIQLQAINVALASAECALGNASMPQDPFIYSADDWVPGWLDSMEKVFPEMTSLWRPILTALIDGKATDIKPLVAALRGLGKERKLKTLPVGPGVVSREPRSADRTATMVRHVGGLNGQGPSLVGLESGARSLRADALNREEVSDYRKALEVIVRDQPSNLGALKELVFVLMCYLHDFEAAQAVLMDAASLHAKDPFVVEWGRALRLRRSEVAR